MRNEAQLFDRALTAIANADPRRTDARTLVAIARAAKGMPLQMEGEDAGSVVQPDPGANMAGGESKTRARRQRVRGEPAASQPTGSTGSGNAADSALGMAGGSAPEHPGSLPS